MTDYQIGYDSGEEDVRGKPLYAPSNPFDEGTQKDLYDGWEDGADSAGINEIYYNGVLKKSER